MRRLLLGVSLVGLLAAGCADILGLDPLGPAVSGGEDGEAPAPADGGAGDASGDASGE